MSTKQQGRIDGRAPDELRPVAARRLAQDVRTRRHLTTGFLGTPYLCHVLARYGYLDEAYRLLMRKEYPSWLYPITQGATTIWERWDGQKPDGSFQDRGMNSFSCSTVVILFLKCHFQLFHRLSGTSPKSLRRLVAAVPGGSSSKLFKIRDVLGGSASCSVRVCLSIVDTFLLIFLFLLVFTFYSFSW